MNPPSSTTSTSKSSTTSSTTAPSKWTMRLGPRSRSSSTGFIKEFDSLENCTHFLNGESPVLSKLGMITKIKNEKTKRRLILDCRRSGISDGSCLRERIVLPRLTDVVNDVIDLFGILDKSTDDEIEIFIIDFTDAFWHIPLKHSERRYYTCKYGTKFLVFFMLAQGSVNAPLAWCRLAALATRLAQSLASARRLRINTYVDDLAAVLRGNAAARARLIAKIIIAWCALGFTLAFSKAARGRDLEWIGANIFINDAEVTVSAKPEAFEEIKEMVADFLSKNVVSIKMVRRLAGKANNIATIVMTWRPFLSELWAAIADAASDSSHRPAANCIWTRQIVHTLRWILAFVNRQCGALVRTYSVLRHTEKSGAVRITLDASPWGIGAFITVDTNIVSWFESKLDHHDERVFGHKIGEAAGQQCWECLAMLVALRLWGHIWKQRRVTFAVRADNVTVLTLLLKMKTPTRSPGINLIAREVALEVGDSAYYPRIFEHTPGIANVIADALSRLHQPGKRTEIFLALRNVQRVQAPPRLPKFFLCAQTELPRGNWRQKRWATPSPHCILEMHCPLCSHNRLRCVRFSDFRIHRPGKSRLSHPRDATLHILEMTTFTSLRCLPMPVA